MSTAKPLVAVSILPQSWFVSRIAGDKVRTVVLVGPGQNPHNYDPAPKQMNSLAEAGAWILSGSEFEIRLRPKIAALFSRLLIVDGVEGVTFRSLEEGEDDHDDGSHRIEGIERDIHTWLGSAPAKIMARHIRDTLIAIDENNAAFYIENYEALINDIDEEFNALRSELAPLRGKSIFVYHPSFGYFLDEFGLTQEAVETGGKEPGPRQLSDLIEKAKREKAAVIFVQAEFPVSAAATVAAAAGAELVSLDPLSPDWLANIRFMGEALKRAALGLGDTK
ncbi:MAG: zinc ABC transporter substrate-binding protein [Treponema sp.]|nr:zinc ABC transporter substrate-binding protein [Treponema sp.]